jgi:hypothetical protein
MMRRIHHDAVNLHHAGTAAGERGKYAFRPAALGIVGLKR